MSEILASKKASPSLGKPHPKVQFTATEDQQLAALVQMYGEKNWNLIAHFMGNRNARQCRDRYTRYLSPDLNKKPWSPEEDALLISKFHEIGPKWVKMSKFFDNRTDYSLKNRWNVLLRHNFVSIPQISEPEEEKIIEQPIQPIVEVEQTFNDVVFDDFQDFALDIDFF